VATYASLARLTTGTRAQSVTSPPGSAVATNNIKYIALTEETKKLHLTKLNQQLLPSDRFASIDALEVVAGASGGARVLASLVHKRASSFFRERLSERDKVKVASFKSLGVRDAIMFPTYASDIELGFRSEPLMRTIAVRVMLLAFMVGDDSSDQLLSSVGETTPAFPLNAVCRRNATSSASVCQSKLNGSLFHSFNCGFTSNALHQHWLGLVKKGTRFLGLLTHMDTTFPFQNKDETKLRADVVYPDAGSLALYLDVTCSSPEHAVGGTSFTKRQVDVRRPLREVIKQKLRKCAKVAEEGGVTFMVGAITHLGVVDGKFTSWLRELALERSQWSSESYQVVFARTFQFLLASFFQRVASDRYELVKRVAKQIRQ
jgi:hypothetical protein